MSERIPVDRFEIKYVGVFDYDDFYKSVKAWFDLHGFTFFETMHKFKPPELEIGFKGVRASSGYVGTEIQTYFHAWYMKEVEVQVKGKTKKMVSASIQIHISGVMVLDKDGVYEKSEFLKRMRSFVHRFVLFYKFYIVGWDKVYYEMLDLHKTMQTHLDMTLGGSDS